MQHARKPNTLFPSPPPYRISNAGLTASRPNALSEFNDAIVMSNRPLRDGEMFEIQIERVVDRWSGSIEAGVTLIRPEDLEFPNTMTDIGQGIKLN